MINTTSLCKDFPAELFDLPDDPKPRSIFLGFGYAPRRNAAQITKKKDRTVRVEVFVQASTARIAECVATAHFATVHRCKLAGLVPYTWDEYARVLARAGFQITPDPFATKCPPPISPYAKESPARRPGGAPRN